MSNWNTNPPSHHYPPPPHSTVTNGSGLAYGWANPPSQHQPPPPPPYSVNTNNNMPGGFHSDSDWVLVEAPVPSQHRPPTYSVNTNISGGSYCSTSPYDWVPCHHFNLPPNAVNCGYDLDGSEIFVGLSHHNGDELPCKVIPRKRAAYVCYDGREISVHNFRILVQNTTHYWLPSRDGQVPRGAIPGGRTRTGEILYVGRTRMPQGATAVGKIHPSHRCLYVPFDGKEISHKDYEVLVFH